MEQVEAAVQQVAGAHSMPYWLTVKGPAHMLSQADIKEEDKL
jgi:hypothetical protein